MSETATKAASAPRDPSETAAAAHAAGGHMAPTPWLAAEAKSVMICMAAGSPLPGSENETP